jgi:hypothetical protein
VSEENENGKSITKRKRRTPKSLKEKTSFRSLKGFFFAQSREKKIKRSATRMKKKVVFPVPPEESAPKKPYTQKKVNMITPKIEKEREKIFFSQSIFLRKPIIFFLKPFSKQFVFGARKFSEKQQKAHHRAPSQYGAQKMEVGRKMSSQ